MLTSTNALDSSTTMATIVKSELVLTRRTSTFAQPSEGDEIVYPSSDGEPLAETQQHVLAILTTFALLRLYLQEQQAVVFADQFLYYIEGNPKARVAPDVMVVFDIPRQLYASYKIWEGKRNPAIIFEVTSAKTKKTDFFFKKHLYEHLGVQEYWLFDPYGEWIKEQLRGYRLNRRGVYKPVKDRCSEVLQLRIEPDEYLMSFYRLDDGSKLLTQEELFIASQVANQRLDEVNQRLDEVNQIAAQEKAKAARLAEKLRQLGVEMTDEDQ